MISKRQIKDKIQVTVNIRQITGAMQMVAATKMRKAEEIALQARPYAKKAMTLLHHIFAHAQQEDLLELSPFFKVKETTASLLREEKICLVVVTSDKGLCGAFNSSVLRAAMRFREEHTKAARFDVVTVGKKGKDFFLKRGVPIAARFSYLSDAVNASDIASLVDFVMNKYKSGEYNKIFFCSTNFISALNQKVEVRQALPLSLESLEKLITDIIPKTGRYSEVGDEEKLEQTPQPYLIEPSARKVFDQLVSLLVRVEILHFILESNASEHSARMIAMKNATENAENLIETLTLELNKARQSAITQELAEITTAKEALSAE
ncbi:MAG: ATP synthase F1 subunit gamma [Patescibacteria group bacterium]|nr:ATP synthase F1 subunit gamma [Patescibacteria group bacterium]